MSRPIIASDADLSPPEEALIAGAARGETVDLGGGKIRGRVLRALLNGSRPDWPVAESGVRLSKAVVTDGIDFEGCTVSVPLLLSAATLRRRPAVPSCCAMHASSGSACRIVVWKARWSPIAPRSKTVS